MTVERIVEILNQYPDSRFSDEGDSISVEDIALLLKRQIPVSPVRNEKLILSGWPDVYDCGACGNQLRSFANYCDHCGRPIKKPKVKTFPGKSPKRCYECEDCTEQYEVSYKIYLQCEKAGRPVCFNEENGYDCMKWCPLAKEGED